MECNDGFIARFGLLQRCQVLVSIVVKAMGVLMACLAEAKREHQSLNLSKGLHFLADPALLRI